MPATTVTEYTPTTGTEARQTNAIAYQTATTVTDRMPNKGK
jgi:hypothetical protein